MKKLLFASRNPGKAREIRALLADIEIELVTPGGIWPDIDVEETGSTYGQNAVLKARAYAQAAHLLTLADDSGLEVAALGGAPGVHSARYVPQHGASDSDRRRRLLEALRAYPPPWTARFRCVVALAAPDGSLHLAEGTCPGEIIPEERGTGGFGYDPIFLFPELGKTMAELSMQEKNQVSHRARAVKTALPSLEVLLSSSE